MTVVSEVMTRNPVSVSRADSVQHAAKMMGEFNIGALPMCDGKRLVGMLTDRDIVVRAVSAGFDPANTAVDEIATRPVEWCFDDEDVLAVHQRMSDLQIRRLLVLDRDRSLVGVVALGDLATHPDGQVAATVASVSTQSPLRG